MTPMSRRGGRNKQISPVDDDACLLQRIKNTKKGRPGWLPVAATATSTTKNGASLMIIFFGFSVLLTGRLALKKSASSSSNLAHTTYQAQSVVQDVQFCLHQGQCPIGSACGPSGICQPYHPFNRQPELPEMKYVRREKGRLRSGSIDQRRMDECVQYCVEELTVDEEFRFGSTPIIRTSYSAVAPHFGCVLEFERPKRGQRNMTTTRPTLEESLARRFRSVVRVDPIMSSFAHQRNHSRYTEMQENNSRGLWRAYCHAPCKQSSVDDSCPKDYDCLPRKWYRLPQNSTNPNSFPDRCQPKVRNSQDMSSAMVIVTGSDSGYFTGLVNFAASLRYWAPATRFLVYNLGMTPEELEQVKRWPNLLDIKWRDGIPSHYPSHVSWSDLQNYAWKPLAINESVHEYRNIFWLDAGASIVGPLDSVQEVIERNGIFLAQGQDEHMKYRSHSATYKYFGFEKETYPGGGGPSFAGGIQGHLFPSRYIDSIVKPNAECALNEACIAPPGASLWNHRFDQSVLSILAHQRHVQVPPYTEFVAAQREQLKPGSLDTESPPFVLWTARKTCSHYSRYHGFST